jgi:hypothetical protein
MHNLKCPVCGCAMKKAQPTLISMNCHVIQSDDSGNEKVRITLTRSVRPISEQKETCTIRVTISRNGPFGPH